MEQSPANPSDVAPLTPALAAPVAPGERYEIIDIIRGFALFGVLMGNIMWYAYWADRGFVTRGDLWAADLDSTVDTLVAYLIDDKFYTLFTTLFGLGFAVQLSRASAKGRSVVPTYARRLFILLLMGILHFVLLWAGEVLHIYALLGFLLIFFRNVSDRALLRWIIVLFGLIMLMPVWKWLGDSAAVTVWDAGIERLPRDQVFTLLTDGGWRGIVEVNWNQRASQYSSFRLDGGGWPERCLIMFWKFLVGFYIGRRMILQRVEQHLGLFRRILPWALAIGLLGNAIVAVGIRQFGVWIPESDSIARLLMIPIELGVIALATAYLCILVLLFQRARWKRIIGWLAPMGRMALTNYVMQSVFFVFIFHGVGLEMLGRWGQLVCVGLTVGIFGFQIALSAWWLKRFRFGPLEWVWRCLTYRKMFELRG